MLVKEGFLGVMTTFLSDEKDFGQWYYRKDPTHVAFYRPETFEVIASMMDWTYEIPEKDVNLYEIDIGYWLEESLKFISYEIPKESFKYLPIYYFLKWIWIKK